MSRYTEVGADTVMETYAESSTAVFKIFKPAATGSKPAATLGPGLFYDETTGKLNLSNGTSWEVITSA